MSRVTKSPDARSLADFRFEWESSECELIPYDLLSPSDPSPTPSRRNSRSRLSLKLPFLRPAKLAKTSPQPAQHSTFETIRHRSNSLPNVASRASSQLSSVLTVFDTVSTKSSLHEDKILEPCLCHECIPELKHEAEVSLDEPELEVDRIATSILSKVKADAVEWNI